jgi:hypothetical protein
MYQRWYKRKLKEKEMPLPDSKRAKRMLAELVTNEAPKTKRTRRTATVTESTIKPAFLQEVVEPENQIPEDDAE